MVRLIRPDSPDLWNMAAGLVAEYAASLDVRLDFQNFDHELADLANVYGAPDGLFLLAGEDEQCIGCGAIRRFSESACEMKRLYVSAAGRNRGLGRMLVVALIDEARQLGYTTMLLDTLPSMTRAQELYESLGFESTTNYRFNPVPGAVFMRLTL